MGIVSLFADMTYEGAHSILGPYLKDLGASATQVGLIAGFGVCLILWWVADRHRRR